MYTQIVEFLERLKVQSGYVINNIDGEGNQKVFLNTIVALSQRCEQLDCLVLSKLHLERELKLCSLETNGWRVYSKDMKQLAYKVALGIVESINVKAGMQV